MGDHVSRKKLWAYQVQYTINGKTPSTTRSLEDITERNQVAFASMEDLQSGIRPQQRGLSTPGWKISFMPPAANEPADPAFDDLVAASKDPDKRVKLVITSPAVLAQTLESCYVQLSGSNVSNDENPLEVSFDIVQSTGAATEAAG